MDFPDDIQRLMMAAIDGEIDAANRERLDAYLTEHPEARAEFERLEHLARRTTALRYVEPPPEAWDTYMRELRPRLERQVGFGLLALGLVGLAIAAGVLFTETPAISAGIKLLVGAAFAGIGTLFISVWREKRFVARRERYGRVRR